MLVAANLLMCLFWASTPVSAQNETTASTVQPAVEKGQLPTMKEEDMNELNKLFKPVFKPILHPFFKFVNDLLLMIPDGVAGLCGVALFLSAMVWVGLFLNKDYVNRGRPYKSLATDLRLWTVISMTPHVLVYFYFR
jgi:hypothetical protein